MIKLKQLIQENNIEQRIDGIIKQVSALPDTDKLTQSDLFAPKNNKDIMLSFFTDVKKALNKEELRRRIESLGLEGTPEDIYRRLNKGGSPVRDFLILHNRKLKEDTGTFQVSVKPLTENSGFFREITFVCPYDGNEVMVHFDVRDTKFKNPLRIYTYNDNPLISPGEDSIKGVEWIPTKNPLFVEAKTDNLIKLLNILKRHGYRYYND